ncbi:hypothetical protein BT93_B0852 [Corymbia citriodora subsp. variegata]|nr:hypothetical protein BT93_B0852 [Corymbia citriodora subsp. variegata]
MSHADTITTEYIWLAKIGGKVPKRCRRGLLQDISYPMHRVDRGIYQQYMIRLGDMDRLLKDRQKWRKFWHPWHNAR